MILKFLYALKVSILWFGFTYMYIKKAGLDNQSLLTKVMIIESNFKVGHWLINHAFRMTFKFQSLVNKTLIVLGLFSIGQNFPWATIISFGVYKRENSTMCGKFSLVENGLKGALNVVKFLKSTTNTL